MRRSIAGLPVAGLLVLLTLPGFAQERESGRSGAPDKSITLNLKGVPLRKAIEEIFPSTRHQRCWQHKVLNVLNKVPKSVQPNMKADLPRLETFLTSLPKGQRYAFEFRHGTWSDDAVYELLRSHRSAWCVADTDEEPVAEFAATAPWGYLRLRRAAYTDDDLYDAVRRFLKDPSIPAPLAEAREAFITRWFGPIDGQRHSVAPGITGYWQINGGNGLSYEEMIKLDLAYIENWSMWLDIRLLMRTVPALLHRRGPW